MCFRATPKLYGVWGGGGALFIEPVHVLGTIKILYKNLLEFL